MFVVKRQGEEQSFDQQKIYSSIKRAVSITPVLTTIDIDKMCDIVQTGMAQKMLTSDIVPYMAETAASMAPQPSEMILYISMASAGVSVRKTATRIKRY